MLKQSHPLNSLYKDIKPSITVVCRGRAIATNSLDAAEKEGLPIIGDLENRVSVVGYLDDECELIVVS